ncbi:MAG: hypothetical protein J6T16_05495 [Opitutales bacterium]|nr:hypothetical protein [Opitutales bacterium]
MPFIRTGRAGYNVADLQNKALLEELGAINYGYYLVAPGGKISRFFLYENCSVSYSLESQCKYLLGGVPAVSYAAPIPAKKGEYWGEDFKKAFADAKKRKKLVLIGFSSGAGFSGGILYNSPDFKKYAEKNCECVAVELLLTRGGFLVPEGKNKIQNEELFGKYLSKTFRPMDANGKIVLLNPENMSAIRMSIVSNFEAFKKTADAFKNGKFEFYGMAENFPFYAVYWDSVKNQALQSGKKIIIAKEQLNLSNYSMHLKSGKFMGFLYEPCVFRKNEAPLYRSEMFEEFVETPDSVCFYDPAKDEFDIVELSRLNAYLQKKQ